MHYQLFNIVSPKKKIVQHSSIIITCFLVHMTMNSWCKINIYTYRINIILKNTKKVHLRSTSNLIPNTTPKIKQQKIENTKKRDNTEQYRFPLTSHKKLLGIGPIRLNDTRDYNIITCISACTRSQIPYTLIISI